MRNVCFFLLQFGVESVQCSSSNNEVLECPEFSDDSSRTPLDLRHTVLSKLLELCMELFAYN